MILQNCFAASADNKTIPSLKSLADPNAGTTAPAEVNKPAGPPPKIVFEQTVHDFGLVAPSSVNPCEFYPSPDGKSYARADYESIRFSDGRKYPSPLNVGVYQDKGKVIYRWIALENNKDVVVYQRTM